MQKSFWIIAIWHQPINEESLIYIDCFDSFITCSLGRAGLGGEPGGLGGERQGGSSGSSHLDNSEIEVKISLNVPQERHPLPS